LVGAVAHLERYWPLQVAVCVVVVAPRVADVAAFDGQSSVQMVILHVVALFLGGRVVVVVMEVEVALKLSAAACTDHAHEMLWVGVEVVAMVAVVVLVPSLVVMVLVVVVVGAMVVVVMAVAKVVVVAWVVAVAHAVMVKTCFRAEEKGFLSLNDVGRKENS